MVIARTLDGMGYEQCVGMNINKQGQEREDHFRGKNNGHP
jgi:hypothetical protein